MESDPLPAPPTHLDQIKSESQNRGVDHPTNTSRG